MGAIRGSHWGAIMGAIRGGHKGGADFVYAREKWPKIWTKIQCFDQDFEKMTFKLLLFLDHSTILLEKFPPFT